MSFVRHLFLCAVAVFALSCREAPVRSVGADLIVEPARLEFGTTELGSIAHRAITLRNSGRGPLEIRLSVTPPFEVVDAVRLEGGEERELKVSFAAVTEGTAEGALEVTVDGSASSVALRGDALKSACAPVPPCHERVATEQDRCAIVPLADGTSCETTCIAGGVCAAGTCVGAVQSCDDANLCTTDACGTDGCVHVAVQCVEPTDKCRAAICDPVKGCTTVAVDDGTSCGVADGCGPRDVCMSGMCTQVPTPDGVACTGSCGTSGTCAAGMCDSPPLPMFERCGAFHMGAWLADPVVDDEGSLYLVVRPHDDVYTLSKVGTSLWKLRGATKAWERGIDAISLLWHEGLLVMTSAGDSPDLDHEVWAPDVRAVDAASGKDLWVKPLFDLVPAGCAPPVASPYAGLTFSNLALDSTDRIGVMVNADQTQGAGCNGGWLVFLDPLTGAVLDTRPGGPVRSLAFDRNGNSVVESTDYLSVGVSPNSGVSSGFSVHSQSIDVLAILPDRLLLQSPQNSHGGTVAWGHRYPSAGGSGTNWASSIQAWGAVGAGSVAWLRGKAHWTVYWPETVSIIDVLTGITLHEVPINSYARAVGPALAANGRAVFLYFEFNGSHYQGAVRELAADGTLTSTPADSSMDENAHHLIIGKDVLYVFSQPCCSSLEHVSILNAPGFAPARSGWSTRIGNAHGHRRPDP